MTDLTVTPKIAEEEETLEVVEEQPSEEEVATPAFEDDEGEDDGSEGMRQLRARVKEQNAELKELRQYKPKPKTDLRERPTLWDDHQGDEDAFAADLQKWFGEKAEISSREEEAKSQMAKVQEVLAEKQKAHTDGIASLGHDDAADMDGVVQELLLPWQHELLVRYSGNSPALTYALGKNPTKLAQLASENQDVIQFAFQLRELEGKMNMSKKRAPVDAPVGQGQAPTLATGTWEARLKAAEKKADETGDRTDFQALKREARAAGFEA